MIWILAQQWISFLVICTAANTHLRYMLVSKWLCERESDKMLFNMRLPLIADKYES